MEASMSTLKAGILLFLVMDPIGNIPLCVALLEKVPEARKMRVLARELMVALLILFVFLWSGEGLLSALQLEQEAVSIAGGIILFIIAIRMIFSTDRGIYSSDGEDSEPFIVPIAIPAVAGPSTMATVMLLANSDPGRTADWSAALFLSWLAGAVILLASIKAAAFLGKASLTAMARLMGMILVALSVQMILDGTMAYLVTHYPGAG